MPHGADQTTPLAEDLARRGYAAWNLEYRRLGDGGGYPATFDDVRAGLARLARLAHEGDALDPARIVVVGHSAGGHLALWAASQPRSGLLGACGLAPITDLAVAQARGLGNGAIERLVGGTPDAVPERYAAASVPRQAQQSLDRLIVHGEDDEAVPVAMSRDFAATAERVALRTVPGCGHFEPIDPASDAWGVVLDWLEECTAPRRDERLATSGLPCA